MPAPVATPASPISGEALLPQTTAIVVDVVELVAGVDTASLKATVNGTLVYNGATPAFLASWTGSVITRPQGDGYRLVLNTPSPFAGGRVDVMIEATSLDSTVMAPMAYSFFVQIQQVTTSADAQSPRVVEVSPTTVWLGYVRNGLVYLRKEVSGVLTGEVQVVPGEVMDVGFDPVLSKFVLLYSNNGKVFYVLADVTDTPATLPQPAPLRTETRGYLGGSDDSGAPTILTFTPLKSAPPLETARQFLGNSDDGVFNRGPNGSTTIDFVIMGPPPTPWRLRIFPPSSEYSTIIGFRVYKMVAGTLHVAMFVPNSTAIPEYVEVEDPVPLPDALYGVGTVVQEVSGAVYERAPTSFTAPPQLLYTGMADIPRQYLGSSEDSGAMVLLTFPPLKATTAPEIVNGDEYLGGSDQPFVAVSGFTPIGVG